MSKLVVATGSPRWSPQSATAAISATCWSPLTPIAFSPPKDPLDDFEEDDFDDDFDDDFEEDWEDDLTEDDEFPDTFGGADEPDEDEVAEPIDEEGSPFADDPDFDEA
jgi:hypothetical protein